MTKKASTETCRWCRRPFAVASGPGRPRRYCRQSCRQADYVARRRAREVGLGDEELVVARAELDELHDRLYVLEAAVEDVERDLEAGGDDPAEVRRALDWLLDAARQAVHRLDAADPTKRR